MATHHARALRASRSRPPGLADDDPHRRTTYQASLQQFEELLEAARVVGPASRPLPLYYALNQAGRAIVAAFGQQPDITSPGLSEDRGDEPDLLHRRIRRAPRRDGTDGFGAVAKATGCAELEHGAEIGALWLALPGVHIVPEESIKPDWRLSIMVDTGLIKRPAEEGVSAVLSHFGGTAAQAGLEVLRDGRYPTIPVNTRAGLRGEISPGNWIADVVFPDDEKDEDALLDRVAPRVYDTSSRELIPALPRETEVLSPLMLWWALLFGLSVMARYHPGPWTTALAVEGSSQAVPIEALLDKAIEVLPPLVYEALFLRP